MLQGFSICCFTNFFTILLALFCFTKETKMIWMEMEKGTIKSA